MLLPVERAVEDVTATRVSAMIPRMTEVTMMAIPTVSMAPRYCVEAAASRAKLTPRCYPSHCAVWRLRE